MNDAAPVPESVLESNTVKPDLIRRLKELRAYADKKQAYEAAAWLLASYIADNDIGDALYALSLTPRRDALEPESVPQEEL